MIGDLQIVISKNLENQGKQKVCTWLRMLYVEAEIRAIQEGIAGVMSFKDLAMLTVCELKVSVFLVQADPIFDS